MTDSVEIDHPTPGVYVPNTALVDASRVGFIGGYGSAIPQWNALDALDAADSAAGNVLYVPTLDGEYAAGEVLDHLELARDHLGLRGGADGADPTDGDGEDPADGGGEGREGGAGDAEGDEADAEGAGSADADAGTADAPAAQSFAYTLQCEDYGWYAAGLDSFAEDVADGFDRSEELGAELERTTGRDLERHRPCFGAVARAETGAFWLSLRGTDEDGPTYDALGGVVLADPVFRWPGLSAFLDAAGVEGPVEQRRRERQRLAVTFDEYHLQDIQPTGIAGESDTIAASNPVYDQQLDGGVDRALGEAVTRPTRLPFQVEGGTVAFRRGAEFTVSTLYLSRLDLPHHGVSPVFVTNRCQATSADRGAETPDSRPGARPGPGPGGD